MLLLVADDLGPEMIGAYGSGADWPPTPNIDGLADQGVLFSRAWANPFCSPSRAAIQTGRYAFRNGIGWNLRAEDAGLPLEEITLGELLTEHAPIPYSTAAFGKWHLGGVSNGEALSPNLAGYTRFEGTLFNLGAPKSYFHWVKITDGRESISTRYATTETVDSALRWIESAPEPWFAYVAFHAVHNPLHAPPRELHTQDVSAEALRLDRGRAWINAMLEATDREIGRLIEGLRPELRRRTVILFMSDNGTASGWSYPADRAKGSLYEGGIRVPLIVSGHIVRAPGSESSALVSLTDIFATLAELGGVDRSALQATGPRDSVSLVPYLRDPGARSRRSTVYSEKFYPNGTRSAVWSYAIRDDRYKLIRIHGTPPRIRRVHTYPFISGPERLYDLEEDPGETKSLLAEGDLSPEARRHYRELTSELGRLLEGQMLPDDSN